MKITTPSAPVTGVVLLNMGGPSSLDQVQPFLMNLFADRELMTLPFQRFLGPFIARRRTRKVQAHYAAIGGGSPILEWTRRQGAAMTEWLDELSPQTGPHRAYVAFRYAAPFAADALQQMAADGIRRAVAFAQYPHYARSTTGSSLNELWRSADRLGLRAAFEWHVIDRWPVHPGLVQTWVESIRLALADFPAAERGKVLLVFSAHALPLNTVQGGDAYPMEINACAYAILQALGLPNDAVVCYQSKVGPVKWLGPSTKAVLKQAAHDGRRGILVIPLAFTSEHIETLYELDIEYAGLAQRLGISQYRRAAAPNDSPTFARALAEIVAAHLAGQTAETSAVDLTLNV